MDVKDYRRLLDEDTVLAVGVPVVVYWTNSHNVMHAPGTVTKVNAKSVLVAIAEDVSMDRGSGREVGWPAGTIIKAPRLADIRQWSRNNCVRVVVPSQPGAEHGDR